MKLEKLGLTVIALSLAIGGGMPNMSYAMESKKQALIDVNYHIITPFWNSISDISPDISAEGTTVYSEVYVKAKSSSGSISGTMYLEKYTSSRWTTVTSWSLKGTGSAFASKSYRGTLGTEYRTRVVVTVDGERAEAISGTLGI
ncbi:hypothetical protein CIW83_20590 [Tissierella sp. P1]|uniref:hypothetical protein n=1 Tax=unclassified Tissierella TaxID=2638726 RepID=UPI000BA01150|nr:hypothetical protein [Tissierella sp. P1]MDU5083006.1 cell agglutination protein Mam3 [Bacillota bacterium]OZV10390.1 hypothetical protein CIW83_20590 [Tissierella sp. P1]